MNATVWSRLGSRGTFGLALTDLAGECDDLMALTADLAITSGLGRFQAQYPEKFINVGIAEQNMLGIGAGMAKEGKNVFVTTFATFAAMRSYEQIRVHLGYMGINLKVVGLASGLAMGMFGNTHYGIEDLALMRAVPGLLVLSPADGAEIVKTIQAMARYKGPAYIRLSGAMNNPAVYGEEYDFQVGKAVTLREGGGDVTIIATGTMVHESLAAAKLLAERGVSAAVVNMHTIKPLDTSVIDKACACSRLIVTVEEHSVIGGLGGAVAEYKSRLPKAPGQLFIGLPDQFGKSGEYKYLLEKYGLLGNQIAERIMKEFTRNA